MDYKRETDKWLYNYNSFKAAAENLKMQYTEKEKEIKDGKPVQYDKENISRTNKFNSETENYAMDLALIHSRIEHYENKIKIIDNAIRALNETERRIVELRYFEGKQWWQIAYEIKYCEKWCREYKKRAREKISIALFGEV